MAVIQRFIVRGELHFQVTVKISQDVGLFQLVCLASGDGPGSLHILQTHSVEGSVIGNQVHNEFIGIWFCN